MCPVQGNDSLQEASRVVSASILQRIASGDGAAVEECIEQYGALVWSLARRYSLAGGGTMADAEDAVQDIFIALWENANRFDASVASETTFVGMIARRRLIDRRRKQSRRKDSTLMSEGAPEPATPREERSEVRSELRDEAATAAQALERLRPEQRQVLELSLVHGRSYEQIAHSLSMPLGTVKTHARRGLLRVREELGATGAGSAMEVTA